MPVLRNVMSIHRSQFWLERALIEAVLDCDIPLLSDLFVLVVFPDVCPLYDAHGTLVVLLRLCAVHPLEIFKCIRKRFIRGLLIELLLPFELRLYQVVRLLSKRLNLRSLMLNLL